MKDPKLAKLVINMGIGKSGEVLEKGKKVLEQLTGQKPSVRRAKKTIRDFGIHRGEPIGLVTTARDEKAEELARKLLAARDMKLPSSSFDSHGSCSFGIREHIEIPGVKYDPELGIFGLDASIVIERPGFRVGRRQRAASKIGVHHRLTKDEAIEFLRNKLGVQVY